MEYTTAHQSLQTPEKRMPLKEDDGAPKFGRLLVVLIFAVLLCAGLTWLMATVFPNFPG
jgi:hypothetical protein